MTVIQPRNITTVWLVPQFKFLMLHNLPLAHRFVVTLYEDCREFV